MQSSAVKRPRGKEEDGTPNSKKTKELASESPLVDPSVALGLASSSAPPPPSSAAAGSSKSVKGATISHRNQTQAVARSEAADNSKVGAPSRSAVAGGGEPSKAAASSLDSKPAAVPTNSNNNKNKATDSQPAAAPKAPPTTATNSTLTDTAHRSHLGSFLWFIGILGLIVSNLLLYCAWYDTAQELQDVSSAREKALQEVRALEGTVTYLNNKIQSQQGLLEQARDTLDQTVQDWQAKLEVQRTLLEQTQATCHPPA